MLKYLTYEIFISGIKIEFICTHKSGVPGVNGSRRLQCISQVVNQYWFLFLRNDLYLKENPAEPIIACYGSDLINHILTLVCRGISWQHIIHF